ncbi:MAG: glycosyltransferase family 2 protein [Candidatus Hodarchaeales archaeon]
MDEKIMDLSIITPAAPGRKDRIESIFKRLSLNKNRNPGIDFEFVIVDDSLDQEYLELSTQTAWSFPVKYISLPLTESYPNPSYMRNVGFRIAQGKVLSMIDSDHWIHEDFVQGVISPFKERNVLNTGFMLDTSKGSSCPIEISSATITDLSHPIIMRVVQIIETLINNSDNLSFENAMKLTGINGPVACNRVWLAAYPRETVFQINGYDEKYCMGYSREDDDLYYRLASLLPIHNQSFRQFAGVHLWHPQSARSDQKNALNRNYYDRVNPHNAVRNVNHEWGKFVEKSFSVINGTKRYFFDHELWIRDNCEVKSYLYSSPWPDFEHLRKSIT